MKKEINILIFILLIFGVRLKAQSVYDSTYHNFTYDTRTAYFRALPVRTHAVIFWGDSITQWGDWSEFFGSGAILNRGIVGDNSFGLLNRTDEIIRHQPRKLFILIGTNDLNMKIPLKLTLDNYRSIIRLLKLKSPHTAIYIQSVLPINNQMIGRQYYIGTNPMICEMNDSLKILSKTFHIPFLDVYHEMLDTENQLKAAYTIDGLHLTYAGYERWIDYIKKLGIL